jgi:hypothetical protein
MRQAPQVWIGSMRVRMPGASKEAGQALARSLCEQLRHLPTGCRPTHIGALRLRISGGSDEEPSAVSDAIATRISSKLASNSTHA